MSYEPYPRSMYRLADAGFEFEGAHYAMLTVESAEEEAAAEADGWAGHPCQCKPKGGDLSAAIEVIQEAAESIAKFDHDGDGRPGGSKPRRKKAVKRDDR